MFKALLIVLTLVLLTTGCSEKTLPEMPNVVFIMMDDYGFGQFAANNDTLEISDFDPLMLEFERERNNYSPWEALEMSKVATPTLTRMAEEGVRFTNAFTSSNLCAPSRIGIATGILQNRWGIYRNIDCETHGIKPGTHLVEELKELGYATAHIGKWHIGTRDRDLLTDALVNNGLPDTLTYGQLKRVDSAIYRELKNNGYEGSVIDAHHPLNHGFDYYFGYNMWESPFYKATNVWENFNPAGIIKNYNTDVFTQKAIAFIEENLEKDNPFIIQLHYHAVHGPLDPKAPDRYFKKFNSASFILNNFYAHVFAVDESVRIIEEYLQKKNCADNTIFIFTSDNGGAVSGRSCMPGNAPYIGHKGMYTQGGIRVPLIFYWPAKIKQALVSHQLASTMDILPTVIHASGGEIPDGLDGKSLLNIITGKDNEPVHDYLLWSGIHARAWGFMSRNSFFPPLQAREKAPAAWVVIKGPWMLRFIDDIPAGLYRDIPEGKPEEMVLYHIAKDRQETKNMIDETENIRDELLKIWEKEAMIFLPPARWDRRKWEGIVPPNNNYLTSQTK